MKSRKRKSDWISGTEKPPQEDGEKESRPHKKARSGEAGTGANGKAVYLLLCKAEQAEAEETEKPREEEKQIRPKIERLEIERHLESSCFTCFPSSSNYRRRPPPSFRSIAFPPHPPPSYFPPSSSFRRRRPSNLRPNFPPYLF